MTPMVKYLNLDHCTYTNRYTTRFGYSAYQFYPIIKYKSYYFNYFTKDSAVETKVTPSAFLKLYRLTHGSR